MRKDFFFPIIILFLTAACYRGEAATEMPVSKPAVKSTFCEL